MKTTMLRQSTLFGLLVLSTLSLHSAMASEVNFGERTPAVNEFVDALTPQLRFRGIRPTTAAQAVEPAKVSMQLQFEFDSAELTAASKKSLDNLSAALKTDELNKFRFLVQGHTDAMGGERYNQNLSERRAASVKRYLVDEHGVDSNRLDVVGMGEHEPLNLENPFDATNRRVAILNVGE